MCVDCIGLYHAYSHGIILCASSGLWLYAPSENIYIDLYCAKNAATHEEFETHGADIFHFEGDKIKEVWTMFDALYPGIRAGYCRESTTGAVEKVNEIREQTKILLFISTITMAERL